MTENTERDAQQSGGGTPPAQRTDISTLPPDVQDYIRRLKDESITHRKELDKLTLESQKRRDAELADQQRWQELAETRQKQLDELTPFKDRVSELETVLNTTLEAQLSDLPTEAQQAIRDMPGDARAKLDWLAKNRVLLTRPAAPQYDAGARGDSTAKLPTLSPEEEQIRVRSGFTREQWAAFRAAGLGKEGPLTK